jgi:hypothetical protein
LAYVGGVVAASAVNSSSYRVKFRREEFLELAQLAKPKILYQTGRMHFFSHDGFVVYTFQCRDEDFTQRVLHALEFSNYQWSE